MSIYKICDVIFEFNFNNKAFFETKFFPYLVEEYCNSVKYILDVNEKKILEIEKEYIKIIKNKSAIKCIYKNYCIIYLLKDDIIVAEVKIYKNQYKINLLDNYKYKDNLEYRLLTNLFFEIMNLEKRAVFHASAISYKGNGILFAAKSGTGKSTQADLWKKVFKDDVCYINDDKPILYIESGTIFIWGNPFSGKNDLHSNIKVPLKTIFVVKQSKTNFLRELNSLEKIQNLVQGLGNLNEFKKNNTILDFCEAIIENISIYELNCNISNEAVLISKEKIK